MPEDRSCILFATADWDAPYWTNKQHMARQLAKKGFRVLYIESIGLRAPTANRKDLKRIWRRLRRGLAGPRQVEENIWVLSPLVFPFLHSSLAIKTLNQGIMGLKIKSFARKHRFSKPLIWSYHPYIINILQGISKSKIIYHCVDDLSTIPGIDHQAFNEEEQNFLKVCDAVFVTSLTLKEKCSPYNDRTFFLPNVVDANHFAIARQQGSLPDDISNIPRPRIGYIGLLSDYKVDFNLIFNVAINRTEWHWVLIGEEREGQRCENVTQLRMLHNVHFLGYRPYERLPEYLRGLDVATLPTLTTEYTRAMFPMKYFEYLAAGLPVVSTPLAFTEDCRQGVEVGSDLPSFIAAVERQLQRGRLRDQEAEAYVGNNTWGARLDRMLELTGIGL